MAKQRSRLILFLIGGARISFCRSLVRKTEHSQGEILLWIQPPGWKCCSAAGSWCCLDGYHYIYPSHVNPIPYRIGQIHLIETQSCVKTLLAKYKIYKFLCQLPLACQASFKTNILNLHKCSYVIDNMHFLGVLHIVGPFCPNEKKILIACEWHLYPIPD